MRYQLENSPNGPWVGGEESARKELAKEAFPRTLDDVWALNSIVPEPVEACVHALIKRSVCERPSATAVCSWDGELTYQQLDQSSSKLAHQLAGLGVGPGTIVMQCFEKSMLVPIAMLGVMKAGGASVALDTTQPEDQLRTIATQISSTIILTSSANEHLARRLGPGQVVVVDWELLLSPASSTKLRHELPSVSPSDVLYIAFTSGTTAGAPKGAVITHRNFSSAIIYQQRALGFRSSSRVFDYASYASHQAWANLLHALTCGGCLCIPSESDRGNNIEGSMTNLRANHVQLTPTVARTLDWSKLSGVLQVNYVGEPAAPLEASDVGRKVVAVNAYGSAETTSTMTMWTLNGEETHTLLASPRGGICAWVVDLDDPHSLAPFGAIGELWLEGPLVGQGYLNDHHQTASSFVEDPAWLLHGVSRQPGRHGRAYRTGDLVQYRQDGKLLLVGRKDQAKVQGQLVDLGEVENQMRLALEPGTEGEIENLQLIAETIQPQGAESAILVAFVAFESARDMSDEEYGKTAHLTTVGLTDKLADALPSHMVPSAYIPIQAVPLTMTGKVDRHCLRSIGSLLTEQEIAHLRGGDRRVPLSETERVMQNLWAQVLLTTPETIGRDDDFFAVGGDATKALRLVRLARERGLSFEVRDVFQHARLDDLAALANSPTLASEPSIAPLSLLERPVDEGEVRAHVAHLCHVQEAHILDIMPCTALQAGLLALTARQSGAYVAHNLFEIGSGIDLVKFRSAWDRVVALNPILRTRVVSLPRHGIVQVVLEEGPHWSLGSDLQEFQREHADRPMGLGVPLTRFGLVDGGSDGSRYFLWDIHHALYDGWSLPLLLQEAEHIYYGESSAPLESMTAFIKYVVDREETAVKSFWQAQFANLKGSHFPLPKTATYDPRPDCQMTVSVPGLEWGRGDFTPATVVRAAWAVVVAHSADSDEALFGLTVTGRQAAIPGIERMAGPTIATVPIRVALDWEGSVGKLLSAVQRQAVDMIPYEQTGLQRIRRVGESAAIACGFQSLLVIQPGGGEGGEGAARPFLAEPEGEGHKTTQWQDFSTYAIVVECQLEADEVRLRIGFDSTVVGKQQMGRIARGLERVLLQLADQSRSADKLGAVAMPSLSHASIDDIWSWNAEVPPTVDACVHDMIAQRAVENPSAPAVCAWDGELTYSQLDEMATNLAYRLAEKGVAGTIVPLCFEKSVWMPVAALAVMKAGGASIAMETTQPEERLRGIAAQADSPVVISSVQKKELAGRIVTRDVITIGFEAKDAVSDTEPRELPAVSPSSVLYVVFTSGSTGTPKGAIVTHSNFASAIEYQQREMGYSSTSRVFDFASYAFDASWWNLLHALTAGGCLCIPSALERENDLASSFEKYKVTTADLTPSVARFLGPAVLSRLSTLILGGEAVLPSDASLAGDKTQIINVYGPAECTPTVTFAKVTSDTIVIGRGAGVCTWVVQADDHASLAPIGAVGELWVEGPLVGQGYLNDPEKTAAAFVRDPAWLLRGSSERPGRSGRLYRTGDLVRYREDGALLFVGRKDTQVKIRGQRIELGEVEHHVRQALQAVDGVDLAKAQVTAETIQPTGANSAILIAFITLDDLAGNAHGATVKKVTDGIADRLSQTLPVFMVPSAFIPLDKIPMMTTGKTDRRQLRAIGSASWLRYRGTGDKSEPEEDLTEVEKLLQKVWMAVLNLTLEEASVNKPFTRLGGDSISAMQVVSQCRMHNLCFTASDVLQAGTIRKLAARCQLMSEQARLSESSGDDAEEAGEPFDLSPIQQMFFDAYPEGLDHYNQGFILDLGQPVPVDTLRKACKAIVSRHAMLRARYHKDPDSGRWRQSVLDEEEKDAYAFSDRTVASRGEVTDFAQWRQENLDIRKGPVFACDVFQIANGDQVLVLSAHHLVIDLVSWRIVWGDIEDYVKTGDLRPQKPTSFRTWCRRQAKVASSASPLTVLPFTVPPMELDFWGLAQKNNTFGNCNSHTENCERDMSNLLLADGNEALRTEPIDLMIGAIVYSFLKTFPDRPVPVVWVEGHGREQSKDLPVDVSETVGWFTTMYPIPVPITHESSLLDAVRLAKDTRCKVPGKGQPYFACRYHSASGREAFQGHEVAEITLNFTGRYQQLESEDSLFGRSEQQPAEAEKTVTEVSETAMRTAMIEVNAGVEQGNLGVSFCFHKDMKHQDRLRKWSEENFALALKALAGELRDAPVSFTLSDLPLMHMSYRGLDTLLKEQLPSMNISPNEVADIYPCSPLQEGILLSSLKGAATYDTFNIYRCVPSELATTSTISPAKLEAAWRRVVPRHSIMSTVFSMHPEGNGFVQIVLANSPVRVRHVTATREQGTVSALCNLERPVFSPKEPQHELVICQCETGEVAIRLDVSHALIDAYSIAVLVQELTAAYDGVALPQAPSFGGMVRFIDSTPKTQRVAAWTSLLDGVEPCVVPVTQPPQNRPFQETHGDVSLPTNLVSNITEFCKEIGITRAVFLQVAWSMALSQFTGMPEVCFGYLASGRDAPVDKIEAMVGPLANLLISRIDLREPTRQVLETASHRSIQHLAMQHASLAEIQHQLGLAGKRLFNTSLSIREADKLKGPETRTFSFEVDAGEDPHEYDLSLSANIDGNKMDIVMEYRQPYIGQEVARKACVILSKAIEYLLEAGASSDGSESLFGGFFKQLVGADEAAATDFWRQQFANVQGSHYPALKNATYSPRPDSSMELDLKDLYWTANVSTATAVRAAWSVVTARSLGSNEALFGAAVDGDFKAIVPVRVSLDWERNIEQLLQTVQAQAIAMTLFEHTGLPRIRRISEQAAAACDFKTLLVTHDGGSHVVNGEAAQEWHNYGSHAIVLELRPSSNGARISTSFDSNCISEAQVSRVLHQFHHVLAQLLNPAVAQQKLRDLTVMSQRDLDDIWTWNATVPEPVEACLHDLIEKRASQQPLAPAIHAWDGELTYGQLSELSTRLAHELVGKGVGRGSVVPLCFEKSMWMPVAALAVMKAGGASVAVDSTQPEERIRVIAAEARTDRPLVILSSVANQELVQKLEPDELVVVGLDHLPDSLPERFPELPVVSPEDVLYVVFTSGSTGKPKGAVISHRNYASAITYQRDDLGYSSDARVFDFSSYAFDIVWSNLLNTLTVGACLCIPSAAERENNLAGALEKYKVTVSDLTPSVARFIEPKSALHGLNTLLLGGEVVLPSDALLVRDDTLVVSAYGPAECTPTATILHLKPNSEMGIGRAAGLCTWVVDMDNPEALAPIGAIGELWLEGPLVGLGYLKEPEKTAAAFIRDPAWLTKGAPGTHAGRSGITYRTGDLVQYKEDGTLLFIGRKDTQVKIRGQRVELGEVEHHVLQAVKVAEPAASVQIIAETIQPKGSDNKLLVAFVAFDNAKDLAVEAYEDEVRQLTIGLNDRLAETLPVFMLPSVYIPIQTVPMMTTGKADRRQLRAIGSAMSAKDIARLSRVDGERRAPRSDAERAMQALWAEILRVEPESIGIDDSFFRIGGDSIGAMKLVGLARHRGFALSVRDVFQNPILLDLAAMESSDTPEQAA